MRAWWIALLSLILLMGCSSVQGPVTTLPAPVPAPTPDVKPVGCADWPQAVASEGKVLVWFHCGEEPKAVERAVSSGLEPMQFAYMELLKGPTADERKAGFHSWFKAETANALRSAILTDGRLVVDLADIRALLNGASTSAGAKMLVSQLGRTGAQFSGVQQMEFQFEGSCDGFGDWIQMGCGRFPAEQFK